MALMESPHVFFFVVTVLAVWRITHLIHAEDGPFDLIVRLRRKVGQGFWGTLMDCFYCLSLWIAAPAAWLLGRDWPEWLLYWPAISAAVIFIKMGHDLLDNRINQSTIPLYEEEPPDK